jgi:tetratricopeptide (TPR) repeat protein
MKPQTTGQDEEPRPSGIKAGSGAGGILSEIQAHGAHYLTLGAVCLMVIGFWIWNAGSGGLTYLDTGPKTAYYNLLVQGFQSGQLNLKTEVPPELARAADPYPLAGGLIFRWFNGHRLLDLSYYHGKLYLYFGVTPAVVLFWPYAALTGQYLPQQDAGLIFCAVGFLAGAGLPMLMSRCEVYEVAISCGFAFVMLSLAGVWGALAGERRQGWWLAGASLAYGLALGARPNLFFGAGILLVPVVVAWQNRRPVGGLLAAAFGPIILVGLGLMLYNVRRFGSPVEFGQLYQLGAKHEAIQHFSLRYFWFNLWLYFLEPMRWSHTFPYVRGMNIPPMPAGHGAVEFVFSVLPSIPVVWLGLAAPLAWRGRPVAGPALRGLVGAAVWLGAASGLTLCLYYWVADRYELEFLPALVLLGVVGIFGLERALTGHRWRPLARAGWVLLLVWSVGFNALHAVECRAMSHNEVGAALESGGQADAAIREYQEAIHYDPFYEESHYNLGCAFVDTSRWDEAIHEYQEALRLKPDYAEAHRALGAVFDQKDEVEAAMGQYREVLRLNPDSDIAKSIYNFGVGQFEKGQIDGAIRYFQSALGLKPDYVDARYNLGIAFLRSGRLDDAISQYQELIRLIPNDADAHNNFGVVLYKKGRADEAAGQFQEALRLKPDYAEAQQNLTRALKTKTPPAGR